LPVSGTRLSSASVVTFSVQDSIELASVVISAEHGGVVEVVYDGAQFFGGYLSRCVVEQIAANTLTFRVGGDWRGALLTLRVMAIDSGGNVTRAEGTWPLESAQFIPPGDGTQPGLVYQPDHAGEAERRLLSQFDDAAKLHALVRALVSPLQALEQDAFEVLTCFDVETAAGAQLDIVGGFVGVLRDSKMDIAYRAYIKAKILANASDGTAETILRISRVLLGEDILSLTYVLGAIENHPAHFDLWVAAAALRFPWDGLGTMSSEAVAVALADALFLATSAGVSFTLFYQYGADADTLVFSSVGDEEEDSTTQGLADDDDEGVMGGALIGAEERF
jgi:hypothetical protein